MQPVLAVIIPTFDRAEVLPRAIDSVLASDAPDIEVVVVDDGSTDDTTDVLAAYDDPRLVSLAQRNAGVCAARNAGAEASRAPFLTFLDSDDEAGPGWLRFFAEAAREGVDFASCGVRVVEVDSATTLAPTDHGAAFGHLRARFLTGAFGIRKQLFGEIGGYRVGMRYSENTDLALRLGGRMLADPFVCAATDDALLVVHPSERRFDPDVRYRSAMTILAEDDEHLRRSRHLRATYAAIAGTAAWRLGRPAEARRLLLTSIRANPIGFRNYLRLVRVALPRRRPVRDATPDT